MFSHIPKTAGTSLNFVLRKNFKSKLISSNKVNFTNDDFLRIKNKFSNSQIITGHGLKPHLISTSTDVEWITFLRNPQERFVSQYVHQYTSQNIKFSTDFESWVNQYNRKNWQTRWLGNGDLEKAKYMLTKCSFVGITENFNESLILLSDMFGWRIDDIAYGGNRMISRNNEIVKEINEKHSELIHESNKDDMKLYEFAQNIFSDNCKSYGVNKLSVNLIKFEKLNSKYSPEFYDLWPYYFTNKIVMKLKNEY